MVEEVLYADVIEHERQENWGWGEIHKRQEFTYKLCDCMGMCVVVAGVVVTSLCLVVCDACE